MTKNLPLLFGLMAIYIAAYMIQSHIYINWDVSWLSYLAAELFNHGVNKENFFEVNTPMSIYIYLPAILLQKVFILDRITAIRISIFLLAMLSMGLCFLLMKSLSKNQTTTKILILILAFVFLILPINQFGEREHIFLLMIMPYLFLAAKPRETNSLLRSFIGVLAAIGFSIKPHFIILFAFVEFYLMIQKKSLITWARPEALTIILFSVGYFISIFLLQPDYFNQVLPLAMQYYYPGSRTPFSFFFSDSLFLFCISAAIIYFFQRKNNYQTFGMILLLALVGSLCAYILQAITTYYRLYPAVGLSLLLLSVLICSYQATESNSSYPEILQTFAALLIVFFIPTYSIFLIVSNSFLVKKQGLVSNMITYMNKQNTTGTCYFMSTSPPFPAINYINRQAICSTVIYAQPYWILSGIITKTKNTKTAEKILEQDKIAFIHSMANTFIKNPPDFVFVDKNILIHFMYQPFDYIKYFSTDSLFLSVWKNYFYLNSIENFNVYKKVT
jgi:hypothetical protein